MKLIQDNKYLLLCILGNLMLLALSYREYGRFRFTVLYMTIGFLPLMVQVVKTYKRYSKSN